MKLPKAVGIIGILAGILLGFAGVSSAQAYVEYGLISSENLLTGEGNAEIDSFTYTVSSLPAGTSMKISFSLEGTRWYESGGTALGWDSMSAGTNTIDLSGLAWNGDGFYYKIEFTSDGSQTPVLDEVSLGFTPAFDGVYQEYFTSGTLTSTNVLTGETVGGILEFQSNASDIPANTALKVQFSQDGNTWYNSAGQESDWDTLSQGSDTVDLYALGWTGANLYYQIQFESDNSDTPTLNEATVTFAENYISGIVYADDGTTPFSGQTVRLAVNGVDHGTTTVSANSTGAWAIYDVSFEAGDVVTVYLDDETAKAAIVSVTDGTDMTDLDLRQSHVIARHDNGGSIANANLATALVSGEDDLTDLYEVAAGDLTIKDNYSLLIPAGHSFAPGGKVTIGGSLRINGSYTLSDELVINDNLTINGGTLDVSPNSYGITLQGSWTKQGSGTFIPREGTVTFNGSEANQTITSENQAFYSVTIADGERILQDDLSVSNDLTLTGGILDVSNNNYAVTVSGDVDILETAEFTPHEGTVTLDGNGNQNLSSGTSALYHLNIQNTGTGENNIVNLGGDILITGDLTLSDGVLSSGHDMEVSGDVTRVDGGLTDMESNMFTLSGSDQVLNPGEITMDVLKLLPGAGTVTLQSSIDVSSLISIGAGRTFSLETATVSSNGNFSNDGLLIIGNGQIRHAASDLRVTDSSFKTKSSLSISDESGVYVTVTDANRNTDGTKKETVAVAVTCGDDSETISLTETEKNSGLFRSATALKLTREAVSQGNGRLECRAGDTIRVSYTDNQDETDTLAAEAAVTDIPAVPTLLSGTAMSSTSIAYTWQDNSHNEKGFLLLDENNKTIAQLDAGTTKYVETDLRRGTTYTRKVLAFNDDGSSSASNTVKVTTKASAPAHVFLISPQERHLTVNQTPTFDFHKSKDEDDGLKEYVLKVGTREYTIPADEKTVSHPLSKAHHTSSYSAQYKANVISVEIHNPLPDGTYDWQVTAYDNAGNVSTSEKRTLIIDTLSPVISHIMVRPPVIYAGMPAGFSTSSLRPTTTALLTDNHNLKQLVITLEQQTGALGRWQAVESRTIPLGSARATTAYTPREELTRGGVYRITLELTDAAGHVVTASRTVRILEEGEERLIRDEEAERKIETTEEEREIAASPEPVVGPVSYIGGEERALLQRGLKALDIRDQVSGGLEKLYAWSLDKSGWMERTIATFFDWGGTMYTRVAGLIPWKGDGSDDSVLVKGRENREKQAKQYRETLAVVTEPVQKAMGGTWRKVIATYEMWFDSAPTRIANVSVSSVSSHSAVIEWETNHLTRTAKVNWGVDPMQPWTGSATSSEGLSRQHRLEITDLDPEQTYYFEIMNQNGDYVFDAYYALTTLSEDKQPVTGPLLPQTAVVNQRASVYPAPDTERGSILQVNTGERFRVLTVREGWISILLPSHATGWIETRDIDLYDQTGDTGENRETL